VERQVEGQGGERQRRGKWAEEANVRRQRGDEGTRAKRENVSKKKW
jgi:hypothetical protein